MNFIRYVHLVLVAGLWVGGLVSAFAEGTQSNSTAVDQERAAIEETRRLQTQRLDAQVRDCESKFATTHCLNKARTARLGMEEQLRRREEVLNDAERQRRGQEQLERNREKAQVHAQKLSSVSVQSDRQVQAPKTPPQPNPEAQTRGVREARPLLTDTERRVNARSYQDKHAQVLLKRAEIAKKIKEKGAAKAPLPALP